MNPRRGKGIVTYPVSKKFEELAEKEGLSSDPMFKIMAEVLGEYEHGTADIETLFDEVELTREEKDRVSTLRNIAWERDDEVGEQADKKKVEIERAYLRNLSSIFVDLLLFKKSSGK